MAYSHDTPATTAPAGGAPLDADICRIAATVGMRHFRYVSFGNAPIRGASPPAGDPAPAQAAPVAAVPAAVPAPQPIVPVEPWSAAPQPAAHPTAQGRAEPVPFRLFADVFDALRRPPGGGGATFAPAPNAPDPTAPFTALRGVAARRSAAGQG